MKKETEALPHLGEMIAARIFKRRIVKSALAREVKKSPQVINAYLLRPSLPASVLWELSIVMKHNFFANIASLLPQEFTDDVEKDISKEKKIAQLEREVEILTTHVGLLKELIKKV